MEKESECAILTDGADKKQFANDISEYIFRTLNIYYWTPDKKGIFSKDGFQGSNIKNKQITFLNCKFKYRFIKILTPFVWAEMFAKCL